MPSTLERSEPIRTADEELAELRATAEQRGTVGVQNLGEGRGMTMNTEII